MSEDRARALALRQQLLLLRSQQLRSDMAHHLQPWQQKLATVDRTREAARQGWQWLRGHPEVPAAAVALLVVLRPRRAAALAWRWGRRGWLGWQLWRRVERQVQGQLQSRGPTRR